MLINTSSSVNFNFLFSSAFFATKIEILVLRLTKRTTWTVFLSLRLLCRAEKCRCLQVWQPNRDLEVNSRLWWPQFLLFHWCLAEYLGVQRSHCSSEGYCSMSFRRLWILSIPSFTVFKSLTSIFNSWLHWSSCSLLVSKPAISSLFLVALKHLSWSTFNTTFKDLLAVP